jgi:hypothetical protein
MFYCHRRSLLSIAIICGAVAMALASKASIAQESGTITTIQVASTGVPANDGVFVTGDFTPATGCTNNGFVLIPSDDNFAQSYAGLLAAEVSGRAIQWVFVYCVTSGAFAGYARAHSYAF